MLTTLSTHTRYANDSNFLIQGMAGTLPSVFADDTDADLLADLNSRLNMDSAHYKDTILQLRRELDKRGVEHR